MFEPRFFKETEPVFRIQTQLARDRFALVSSTDLCELLATGIVARVHLLLRAAANGREWGCERVSTIWHSPDVRLGPPLLLVAVGFPRATRYVADAGLTKVVGMPEFGIQQIYSDPELGAA
jgi:hypothetical protein